MKPIIFNGVIILATVAGEAMAACPGTNGIFRVGEPTSRGYLRPAVTRAGFSMSGEYFNETLSGGKVLDFKRGPGSTT